MPEMPLFPLPVQTAHRLTDQEYHQRVNMLMAQWEVVSSLNEKFLRPCVDVCDSRIVPTFERAVVLEVSASVALPFSVEEVDRATWKLCQQFAAPTDTDYCMHDRIVTDDTINGVFSSTIRVDAIHGTMNGKFLTKRYKSTPTQRLFVTHMYCEPEGFRNDLDDVTIHEDSWIRHVNANELSESSLDATLTMLQFVQRTRIGLENKGDETSISVADKAALFMARIEADLAAAQQTLDRLLMQPDKLM